MPTKRKSRRYLIMQRKYIKTNFEIQFDEEKHEYTIILNGKEIKANLSVTQSLKLLGVAPEYSDVDPEVLANAAKRGTYCHNALEDLRTLEKFEEDFYQDEYANLILPTYNAMIDYDNRYNELKVFFKLGDYVVAGGVDEIGITKDGENYIYVADYKFTYSCHKKAVEYQLNFYKYAIEYMLEYIPDYFNRLPRDIKITKLLCNHKGTIHELKVFSDNKMQETLKKLETILNDNRNMQKQDNTNE